MDVWKTDGMRVPVKSWCSEPDTGTVEQITQAARLPFAFRHIALMPDGHSGYGVPVGTIFASQGAVIPYFVGVDIGCGMHVIKTSLTEIDMEALKRVMGTIRELVPLGFTHHAERQAWDGFGLAPQVPIIQQQLEAAQYQLGTLGGGNHFIEIQRGDDGFIWLMLHSGSRNFGLKVANEYHKQAVKLCERWYSSVPNRDLSFLPIESEEAHGYLDAMNYCLRFASANRSLMADRIMQALAAWTNATARETLSIHHNYAVFEHHFGADVLVHRKGAIRAYEGQIGIIPGSMGSASYIVQGLGNPESFMSCSHGAGRRMGRKEAQRSLNLEEEQAKMSGIVHGLRTKAELEEAPGAYKAIEEVMANQADLVTIKIVLRPIGVIKA